MEIYLYWVITAAKINSPNQLTASNTPQFNLPVRSYCYMTVTPEVALREDRYYYAVTMISQQS